VSRSDNRAAVTPEDIQILEDCFAEGGVLVSTHAPTEVEAWVEEHYDDPVFESARALGFSGPIAAMLSPDVPALAVFGSILDDHILGIAKTLAAVSGFAVMVRPTLDDPVAKFTAPVVTDETPPGISSTSGPLSGEGKGPSEGENEDQETRYEYAEGPAMRLRGGRGDDSDEEECSIPWRSKNHKAVVWLNLRPDDKHKYALSLRTKTSVRLCFPYQILTLSCFEFV
jgi:hypothetical protein